MTEITTDWVTLIGIMVIGGIVGFFAGVIGVIFTDNSISTYDLAVCFSDNTTWDSSYNYDTLNWNMQKANCTEIKEEIENAGSEVKAGSITEIIEVETTGNLNYSFVCVGCK